MSQSVATTSDVGRPRREGRYRPVDGRLLNALRVLEESGEATRPWFVAGRYLSLCQRCDAFLGDSCRRHTPSAFLMLLVTQGWDCPRWDA